MNYEKQGYIKNYESFMQMYLKDKELTLQDFKQSNQIIKGYYHLRCFYNFNYNKINTDFIARAEDFRVETILEKFKGQEWQFKRSLCLYLEYLVVEYFKLEDNPNPYDNSWDFHWNGNKVDLKLSIGNKAKRFRGCSSGIFNKEIILNELDIYVIIEMLRYGRNDKNYRRRLEIVMEVIKKSLDAGNI